MNSCTDTNIHLTPTHTLSETPMIPYPKKVSDDTLSFALSNKTVVQTNSSVKITDFLYNQLEKRGIKLENPAVKNKIHRGIILDVSLENDNNEAYTIAITEHHLTINGASQEGLARGIQTFIQLIPSKEKNSNYYAIPSGYIEDFPSYSYRGAMLDVARHFFTVDEVKRYIDQLVQFKFNKLHLHLTDDQGWRIEIKKYPKLTSIGGLTEVGGTTGGYYTQEEYKELVKYASDRFIEIIPEIDMPSHSNAASVAYPFLNGTDTEAIAYTGTNVGFSSFNTHNEKTYEFLDDVLKELAEISPSKYLHIGGDESHSTKKEDYIYFINKVGKLVNKYDKIVVGWDEIANAENPKNSIAQYWADIENTQLAQRKGMKIILSPAQKIYLDMQYDSLSKYGLHWAGYVPVQDSYDWNPETLVEGIEKEDILGIEAPLWSETVFDSNSLEYMVFPRLLGVSELAWGKNPSVDWNNYRKRLENYKAFFEREKINYYPSKFIDWK